MSNWLWPLCMIVIGGGLLLLWWLNRSRGADWGNLLLNLVDGGVRLFVRLYHRYRYEPLNLPQQGGVLLVSNHVSGLDPMLLVAACRRPVRFLIARQQYQRFGLQWLFRAMGCIPVERNGRMETSFRAAVRALQQGEVVALFPGGGIHPSHRPAPALKPGVVRLAKATGVPVIPVSVSGVSGEGRVMMAVLIPGKARLVSYPPLHCHDQDEQDCLQQLADILNRNHRRVTSSP